MHIIPRLLRLLLQPLSDLLRGGEARREWCPLRSSQLVRVPVLLFLHAQAEGQTEVQHSGMYRIDI